jgi:isopentenyl diphosphate isomerase/L-lactate dehydrogenase-like FMN-dependent dehydrogenase
VSQDKCFLTRLYHIILLRLTMKSVRPLIAEAMTYINWQPSAFAENARAFSRFFFHARVMRPVSHCDSSTTILGYKSSIPVFVSGAALAKLGHPRGDFTTFYH